MKHADRQALRLSYIRLLFGIVAISLSAILVKWAGVDATAAAFYRLLYAGVMLLVLDRVFRKAAVPSLRWVVPALLAGACLAADLVIWHKTIYLIGAGPATFLGNSQVLFMCLYAALFYRERIRPLFLLAAPVVLAGLYLLIPRMAGMSVGPGFWMGLTVGMTYAGFLLSVRWAHERAGKGYPEILSLAVTMLFGAGLAWLYGACIEHTDFKVADLRLQGILLLMGAATQGWVWIKSALNRIPVHQGSLLLLIQPVLTVAWGALFFREPFSPVQALGMLMTLGGIGLYLYRAGVTPE